MDYYAILSVPRDAKLDEIKRAYRKLALKWHPEKHADNKQEAQENFDEVAEAFEVLSNSDFRAVFDQYTEGGLKQGVPDAAGAVRGGYKFNNNADQIFEAFFGTSNPFADFGYGVGEVSPADLFAAGRGEKQGPVQNRELVCTLEELYNGAVKKIPLARAVLNDDGASTRTESKTLSVRVQPGWKSGTKITFPREGDAGPSATAADVTFALKQAPHASFERVGSDLHYTANISLTQALTSHVVQVPHLDGRTLSIACNEVIAPGYTKTVAGEGMPDSGNTREKGDLVLKFAIGFPKFVPSAKQDKLRALNLGGDKEGNE